MKTQAIICFFLFLAIIFSFVGCDCSDDESSGNESEDDDTTDDDESDDDLDDDITDDDSDGDSIISAGQYIAGGTFSGAALAIDHAGYLFLVSGKSRQLRAYNNQATDWDFEVADFGVFANPSVAIGSDGSLHICYYDWYDAILWYATNVGNEWAVQAVDTAGDVGHYSSIVVDQNDIVHIAYNLEVSRESIAVKYANNATGEWATQVVEAGNDIGAFPCLAVDSAGQPYVTYNDLERNEIHLARLAEKGWEVQALAFGRPYGRASGIAVDSLDQLHIAYGAEDGANKLRYQSGVWSSMTSEWVDETTPIGDSISLAVDQNDVVHIAYYNSATSSTMYAHPEGKAWTIEDLGEGYPVAIRAASVDHVAISIGNLGVFFKDGGVWEMTYLDRGFAVEDCALAADSTGVLHIVFLDATGQSLRYAHNTTGEWQIEVLVDVIGGESQDVAIAMDANDHCHITFYNDLTHELGYATDQTGTWEIESIDSTGIVGTHSSIAVDAQGMLHVSYYDASNGDLKYATNAGGEWEVDQVDSDGIVGLSTSLTLGTDGLVHIAYVDASDSDINYAIGQSGGVWTAEPVDQSGGDYISLVLDESDQAHVVYVGAGVRYVSWYDDMWYPRAIDPNGIDGETSVQIEAGALKVAYQSIDWNLSYAYGQESDWTLQMVDEIGKVGSNVSLAIAPNGYKYIAYVGEGALWLAVLD